MASSSATSRPSFTVQAAAARPRATPLLTVLFLIFTTLVILRVAAGSLLLDQFMDYTTDSGSPFAKLHPTFYGFVAITLIALPTFRIELNAWELRVVRRSWRSTPHHPDLVMTALDGRGGSAGFLIDSYCGASFVVLLFLFPPEWRARSGRGPVALSRLQRSPGDRRIRAENAAPALQRGRDRLPADRSLVPPPRSGALDGDRPVFHRGDNWSRRTKLVVSAIFLAGLGVSGPARPSSSAWRRRWW